jgi:hypothetical protein
MPTSRIPLLAMPPLPRSRIKLDPRNPAGLRIF